MVRLSECVRAQAISLMLERNLRLGEVAAQPLAHVTRLLYSPRPAAMPKGSTIDSRACVSVAR